MVQYVLYEMRSENTGQHKILSQNAAAGFWEMEWSERVYIILQRLWGTASAGTAARRNQTQTLKSVQREKEGHFGANVCSVLRCGLDAHYKE